MKIIKIISLCYVKNVFDILNLGSIGRFVCLSFVNGKMTNKKLIEILLTLNPDAEVGKNCRSRGTEWFEELTSVKQLCLLDRDFVAFDCLEDNNAHENHEEVIILGF